MKHVTHVVMLLALVCLVSSCSYVQRLWPSQKSPAVEAGSKKELPPLYLGTVHQVYPGQRFALLRIIGPMPRAGVTLITHPADGTTSRMGNLAVSADSAPSRGIIAADIRSGVVASGDRVFLYRNVLSRPEEPSGERREGEDDVVTEMPVELPPVAEPALPTPRPAVAPQPVAPSAALLPQSPAPAAPADAEPRGVEVTTPPSSVPQGTLRQPAMPNLPDKAPSYLNDIPDDINQWE